MKKKGKVVTQDPPGEHYKELAREDVKTVDIVTNGNARRHFDEGRMKELADNIRKVGVLEPILVRPGTDGGYILIAGERRLRAARAADVRTIPVRVLDVTEAQAAEIQALENLHREDLGPIEEARAFKTLLDTGGYDVKALADRIDKSESYVYRALTLLALPEAVIAAIGDGELTAAHGHQLARLEGKARDAATDYLLQDPSMLLSHFKDYIEREMSKGFHRANFPLDVEYAGVQACTTCASNSGNQGMLFDGAEEGTCTDPACFAMKEKAALMYFEAAQAQKYKGVPTLGTVKVDGYGEHEHIKGAPVVNPKDPAVKAAVKAHPGAFALGIKKAEKWQPEAKPTAVLVCTDPGAAGLAKLAKEKEAQEKTRQADAAQRDPKEVAFGDWWSRCGAGWLYTAAASAIKAVGRKELLAWATAELDAVTCQDPWTCFAAVLGVQMPDFHAEHDEKAWKAHKDAVRKALAKASEADLLRLCYIYGRTYDEYGDSDENIGELGVDVRSVQKRARAEFEVAWAKQEAEKAAEKKPEGKRGKKA